MGSSNMLGPEHPLSRADSRMRTLRAQLAVTVVLGLAMLACLAAARSVRTASGGRGRGRLGADRGGHPVRARQPARAGAGADRERPRGVAAARRGERAQPAERPPLPPPAGANARRDPRRSRRRRSGGRPCTPTARRWRTRARSCTEVARLLRELPNVRARGVALVTQADPRRRNLTALPRARPRSCARSSAASGTCSSSARATRPRGAASGPRPRLAGCPRRSRSLRAAPTRCAGWPARSACSVSRPRCSSGAG